jgi:hypothetical protein
MGYCTFFHVFYKFTVLAILETDKSQTRNDGNFLSSVFQPAYRIVVGNFEWKRPFGRPIHTRQDNIKGDRK